MEPALRVSTTVLQGNRIEIFASGLKEGESVDVIVFPVEAGPAAGCSVLEIIESLQAHRLFSTVEAVDRYLRREREAWDR